MWRGSRCGEVTVVGGSRCGEVTVVGGSHCGEVTVVGGSRCGEVRLHKNPHTGLCIVLRALFNN